MFGCYSEVSERDVINILKGYYNANNSEKLKDININIDFIMPILSAQLALFIDKEQDNSRWTIEEIVRRFNFKNTNKVLFNNKIMYLSHFTSSNKAYDEFAAILTDDESEAIQLPIDIDELKGIYEKEYGYFYLGEKTYFNNFVLNDEDTNKYDFEPIKSKDLAFEIKSLKN